jgi:hypothetical protein
MQLTPDGFCERLGRQRTLLGDNPDLESSDLLPLIHVFYRYACAPANKDQRRVAKRLQKIKKISIYVWFLTITAVNFSQLLSLPCFDDCYNKLRIWVTKYPIPETLEAQGRILLKALKNGEDNILDGEL